SCHIKASGADLRVYKEYLTPVEQEQLAVKPIMTKLGPAFKAEAAKVAALLTSSPAEIVAASLEKNGYYIVEGYHVLPEHVEITNQKNIVRGKRFIPHVVEPSFGSDRLFYVALEYAYSTKDNRVLMSFPRDIVPIQLGVYPLVSKDGISEKAKEVHQQLLNEGFSAELDEAGSIGRRYARADEAGVCLGVTIDYDSLKDDTVTIRDRDSWQQVRSSIKVLPERLKRFFQGKIEFIDLGTLLSD
ncbi:MAG: His/Gly/Thr/Pro-type tRNA ligase C-terminal domain-containing protein, partial [Candidatus Bathyarchaeota archaeon]|nr:His/Gly/Thr/Pro-type tRNA ligase C-terminal domain-containing protein [Candidatus Bathyarchaeota archaeon]